MRGPHSPPQLTSCLPRPADPSGVGYQPPDGTPYEPASVLAFAGFPTCFALCHLCPKPFRTSTRPDPRAARSPAPAEPLLNLFPEPQLAARVGRHTHTVDPQDCACLANPPPTSPPPCTGTRGKHHPPGSTTAQGNSWEAGSPPKPWVGGLQQASGGTPHLLQISATQGLSQTGSNNQGVWVPRTEEGHPTSHVRAQRAS